MRTVLFRTELSSVVASKKAALTRLVSPRRWENLVDRQFWMPGPWDQDPYDRAQWPDLQTGLPCLAIRAEIGAWTAYVGVPDAHPLYGQSLEYGRVNFCGPTDELHYIEPPEVAPDAYVDENNPLSALDVVRLPPKLWFFGFDAASGRDIVPLMQAVERKMAKTSNLFRAYGGEPSYKNLDYVIEQCAKLAQTLASTEVENA